MSTRGGPFIGSLSRRVLQWVWGRICDDVVDAGFDDLNPAHLMVFRYPTPEGLRPSDLAEELQITKQSVNDLLRHLETHGYILREIDADDGRSRRIRLTARGRLLQDAVWRAARDAEEEAGRLIGTERVRDLREALVALVEALGSGADRQAT